MATPLTPIIKRYMNLIAQAHKTVVAIPSVPADDVSPRYEFEIPSKEGIILQVRMAYTSVTTTDLFLFTSDTGARGSLDEIIRAEGITMCLQPPPQQIYYENSILLQKKTTN